MVHRVFRRQVEAGVPTWQAQPRSLAQSILPRIIRISRASRMMITNGPFLEVAASDRQQN